MTNEEASFCMKQYLPDSDSLECMKCPYYHTVPIEGTENGFTCKADEAHKIAIKALETIPKYKDAYNKGWDDGAKASYEHLKMCEEEQESKTDTWSIKDVADTLAKHGIIVEQKPCEDWHDVSSNEMTLEQARQAVKDLRKKLAEYLEQEPNIVALGEDMRICRESITDEKVLIGFNLAVALCNKHLGESEDKE